MKAAAGDDPAGNLKAFARLVGIPLFAIALFLLAWAQLAPQRRDLARHAARTGAGLGAGRRSSTPTRSRDGEKRAAFYERQDARNAELVGDGRADDVKVRAYTGTPTFYDQIWTSIKTVLFGFAIATLFAVPLGILCGLSPTVNLGAHPAHPDLQAGLAARLAADRDDGRLGGLRQRRTRPSPRASSSRRSP